MPSSKTRRSEQVPWTGAVVSLVLSCGLIGCSATPRLSHSPPVLRNAAPPAAIADEVLLELSPEMQAFLDRYVRPYKDPDTRLDLLTLAVGRHGVLGFQYEPGRTLGAAEAFRVRSGNCLSFANMLVAMARASGLEAEFQEVFVPRDWTSRDNILLLEKHINVMVRGQNYAYVVDITGKDVGPDAREDLLSDAEAQALYYNNVGVDALLVGDLATAYAYTTRAIELSPASSGSWVNLGVILGRNGQLDDAAYAYQAALEYDPGETAALSNLYDIYLARGEHQRAAEVQRRVEHYRRQNPYYLLQLSDQAIAETRYADSLDLLERAISKKNDDHQLHFALARAQYLKGEKVAAEASYQRARELAPPELARYERPLPELIGGPIPGR